MCGNVVGKAAGQRGPSGNVAESLVRDVHDTGGDLLDRIDVDTDSIDRRPHREGQQVVGPNPRERTAVATDGRPRSTQYDGV